MGQCFAFVFDAASVGGNSRARVVGRERAFARSLRLEDKKQKTEQLARNSRRLSTGVRNGNIRTGMLLSPRCRSFVAEYQLTHHSIGRGMSGHVMLARPRGIPDGAAVAVKTLDKKGLSQREVQRLQREVDIYLGLDHAHIARLLRVFDEKKNIYLVMEYCDGGSLESRLAEQGQFLPHIAADTLRQVLSALAYCHSRPWGAICHRDLKLANFVYASASEGAPLKLVDFGLSCVLAPGGGTNLKSCAGTLEFIAPEVLRGSKEGYDESCDLWSAGVICYCLLTGQQPFAGSTRTELLQAIEQGRPKAEACEAWGNQPEPTREFTEQLLQICPAQRPTAAQALQHCWLADSVSGNGEPQTPWLLGEESVELLESVRSFSKESAATRAAAAVLVYSTGPLAGNDAKFAEEQFRQLDTDGNGSLSVSELTRSLQQAFGVSQEEGQAIFDGIDLVKDSEIERSEFLTAALGFRAAASDRAVREAFDRLDLDGDGLVEPAELSAVLGRQFCGQSAADILDDWGGGHGVQAISFAQFQEVAANMQRHVTSPMTPAISSCCSSGDSSPRPTDRWTTEPKLLTAC